MIPIPFTGSLYAYIFWAAYFLWLIPELIGGTRQKSSTTRENAQKEDRGSMATLLALLWIGIFLSFSLTFITSWATITWHRTAFFFIGVALIILGVVLRWYAIRMLGRYFTRDVAVSSDQQVVQRGPYHYIRHPAYSGTLLTMAGIGLAMTNWVSLVVIVLCNLIGHLYRVNIEEKALSQAIGQPYHEYTQHTRRFIPFIY